MVATALLFDLDGTLCDSRPWYADVLMRCGVDRDFAEARLADNQNVIALARDAGVSKERVISTCQSQVPHLQLYPGVEDTLDMIAARGTPMAVVTSLSGRIAVPVLEGHDLRRYFRAVVTPQWGMRPKPHPASLVRAMDLLDLGASEHIYYIGDLPTDAMAASAARISFGWASYGYGGTSPAGGAALITFADVVGL